VPARGSRVLVFLALCPLFDKSICDDDRAADTLSGAFLAGYERALGEAIVRANIAGRCWRSGDNCVAPTGATLTALVIVKRIFFECLRRAGLRVCAVALSSAAAIGSMRGSDQRHFFLYDNAALGLRAFNAPHLKFCSTLNQPWLYQDILVSIGGARTEGPLMCATRMLVGFAARAADALGEHDGGERIYRAMTADAAMQAKGVVGRAWEGRFGDGVDEAAEAAARAGKRRKSIDAGACDAYAVLVRSHGTPQLARPAPRPPRPPPRPISLTPHTRTHTPHITHQTHALSHRQRRHGRWRGSSGGAGREPARGRLPPAGRRGWREEPHAAADHGQVRRGQAQLWYVLPAPLL
jgi:hypothetical protein